jgi:peptidoglycan/xylan/chitin deacetylase (PgdA/CDA1 family)
MTFFPNTPYVKQFPDLFKDIVAAGHEIGYHTTTHANGDWSPASLESDCSYFETTVRSVTGASDYRVVAARPPFGLWYKGGWQDWVESRGIVTAMWSRTIGWDSTPKVIRRTITENGGLILLSHANPLNVQWFKDNADLIQEFATKYHWPTITEALLKDWQPVQVVGLPVGMIDA